MISGPLNVGLITPVDGVSPRTPGNTAERLIVGREYFGQIIAQLDEQTVAVQLDGNIFAMKLGKEMAPGQALSFKYLSAEPNPSFLLIKPAVQIPQGLDKVAISATGAMIGQYLQESDVRLQLSQIDHADVLHPALVHAPTNPAAMAHELKQAITLSGVFYEAHLADFAEGKRPLGLILQEPQNKGHLDVSQIVAKQLDVLEHQSLHWSGPIWPGQVMHWTISADNADGGDPSMLASHSRALEDDVGINSTLELDFPNLQKVVAKFNVRNGVLRIQIEAANPSSEALLKSELADLSYALQDGGQKLESLLVKPHE